MRSKRYAKILLAACLGVGGCAHKSQPAQDMTVEQHQAAARKDMSQAEKEKAAAYTNAPGATPLNGGINPELYLYPQSANLVQSPLERAQILEQHAREHQAAAVELEHFEDAECKTLPSTARSTCPLLGTIAGVQDVAGGVRVKFNDSARAAALLPRMRCHQAYAQAHGFTSTPDCALYIRGVAFHATPDPQAIDIVGSDPKTTAEIRKRIRASLAR